MPYQLTSPLRHRRAAESAALSAARIALSPSAYEVVSVLGTRRGDSKGASPIGGDVGDCEVKGFSGVIGFKGRENLTSVAK